MTENTPEIRVLEMREMWREFARLITFFDLCSPSIFFGSRIGEFFRKKRARQDSNLRQRRQADERESPVPPA
jgi:hypothetical protein